MTFKHFQSIVILCHLPLRFIESLPYFGHAIVTIVPWCGTTAGRVGSRGVALLMRLVNGSCGWTLMCLVDDERRFYHSPIPSGYDIHSLPWYRWSIEIDGLPNLKMVIFHGYVKNNQMVDATKRELVRVWLESCTDFGCQDGWDSILGFGNGWLWFGWDTGTGFHCELRLCFRWGAPGLSQKSSVTNWSTEQVESPCLVGGWPKTWQVTGNLGQTQVPLNSDP